MKAYKVVLVNPMGFYDEEKYFLNKKLAIKKYQDKLDELKIIRKVETSEEQEVIEGLDDRIIKRNLLMIWEKISCGFDEWELRPFYLELKEIEIQN
ncbi:MAG: hypothetical protein ACOCP8_04095 [archaeon]